MASAYIERRKKQHKCTRCRKDAPLGQGVCFDCADKMGAAKANHRAQGLCLNCWQRQALPNLTYCIVCRDQAKTRRKERYHARKNAGLCVECGKAPQYHRKTICSGCWGKRHGL